jgi:hypothetical protein
VHSKVWSLNLKGKDHSEALYVDGKILILLEWILGKQGRELWSEYISLRIGISGELL